MGKSSQNFDTSGHKYNREQFMVLQYLKNVHTCLPVQVVKVYPKAPGSESGDKVGFLNVKLMIEQLDNEEKLIETDTLYNLPYLRYQGGRCAFVVDPEPGDFGFALFCERDISKFKRQQAPNVPDTYRMFDQADGLYVGGILNKTPEIYVQLHPEKGIIIEATADLPVTVHGKKLLVNAVESIHLKQGGGFDSGGSDFMLSGGDAWLYAHNINERYEQKWNEQPPAPSGGGVRAPTMPEDD